METDPMRKISRRQFLEDSLFAAAAAAAAASATPRAFAFGDGEKKVQPLERLRVATIGVNGQGGGHLRELRKNRDVEIVAICDVDPAAYEKRREGVEGGGPQTPGYVPGIPQPPR